MTVLKYKVENPSALAQYVLDFICQTLGVAGQASESDYQLYYGNQPDDSAAITIPYRPSDVLWRELLDRKIQAGDFQKPIPFDLISAIGAFLSDSVHAKLPDSAYDKHDRLTYAASFPAQTGYGEIPIVNVYVEFLRGVLKLDGMPLWKDGKRCAIALTHDVDRLHNAFIPRAITLARSAVRQKKLSSFAKIRSVDDFALFRQVMDIESQYGFKSTFFFVGMPLYSRYRSVYDVLYDIKDFPDLLAEVRERGFGVGLHASYNTYRNPQYLRAERERLEHYSGGEVIGLRHHFWHMQRDSALPLHEQASFRYDASIAFNEHMGFRRGVALPFYPWGDEGQIKVLQFPTFSMDGHLFYQQSSIENAIEKIQAGIENIKQTGGLGVIDWHSDTAHPQSPYYSSAWGICYERVLAILAADADLRVSNLEDLYEWLQMREKKLHNVHEF